MLSYFFNTREIAIIFWVFLLFILLLCKKDVRSSLRKVIKIALARTMITFFLGFLFYVLTILIIFYEIGLWDFYLLKDTIIWFLASGLSASFAVNQAKSSEKIWTKLILRNLKIFVLIEFISNFYTFHIIIELILVPLLFIIGGISGMSKNNDQYNILQKPLMFIESIIGLLVLLGVFIKVFLSYTTFFSLKTAVVFVLPIALLISSFPYLYLYSVQCVYEELFIHVDNNKNNSKKLKRSIKIQIVKICFLNLHRLKKFNETMRLTLFNTRNYDDIEDLGRVFREKRQSS